MNRVKKGSLRGRIGKGSIFGVQVSAGVWATGLAQLDKHASPELGLQHLHFQHFPLDSSDWPQTYYPLAPTLCSLACPPHLARLLLSFLNKMGNCADLKSRVWLFYKKTFDFFFFISPLTASFLKLQKWFLPVPVGNRKPKEENKDYWQLPVQLCFSGD